MKKLLLLIFFIFLLAPLANSQTSVPSGTVSGTWNMAGSPYQIQGNIQIPNGQTLTIDPGIYVEFQGTYKLDVQGRLLAVGTAADTIVFTAANTSTGWKGMRFSNTPATNDTSKIKFCKLQYGNATGSSPDNTGGAMYFLNVSKVLVSNSRISNCKATSDGGGLFCNSSNIRVSRCIFSNNSAASGGGIACYYGTANLRITDNIISNNAATYGGGGIYCISSIVTISNNTISNNTAPGIGGGGLFFDASSSMISNNTITNNQAATSRGGAIFCYSSSPTFLNNTIANNSAQNGGALTCVNTSNPVFRNTIFYGNTASASGAQVFLEDEPCDPNFYYCDVQGSDAAFGLSGTTYSGTYLNNIDVSPLFASPSGGSGTGFNGITADWSLQNNSPCVDTGDPTIVASSTDKAGNPRVTVCRIDMGAYEFQNGVSFGIAVAQTAPILCNGYATAGLLATASGGTSPYTYSWSPGGETTSAISNLIAGNYSVSASFAGGCTRNATITVAQPAGMTLNTNKTNIDCSGNCIGSATVTVSGGTAAYTYSWSSGETTSVTNTNLCSGDYTVAVTDASGCSKTSTVTISTPSSLSFSHAQVNVSCNGGNNGSITVNASGGSSSYQYSKDGGINFQAANIFTGLAAGTYSLVVKDGAGCITSTTSVTVTEPLVLSTSTSQTNVACFGGSNGMATAIVSGGTVPYTYAWNTAPIKTTGTISGLSPGSYSVLVTDSKGCTSTASVSIVSAISNPTICLVTVDSLSQYNIILWDKTPYAGGSVDSFIIYREISLNNYQSIGAVPYSALSLFTDTVRTKYAPNTGDPNSGTYRYKIAARDTCGNYSVKSPYHNTIYMTNNSGNFSWVQLYTIEGSANPVNSYVLIRDDFNAGSWHAINSVSGSQQNVNDPAYAAWQATANWRIETQWNITCTPTIVKDPEPMGTVKTTKSNTFKTGFVSINETPLENRMSVYPNPSNGKIQVAVAEGGGSEHHFAIYNMMGQLMYSETFTGMQEKIVVDLAKGIYQLKVETNSGTANEKIIIQ